MKGPQRLMHDTASPRHGTNDTEAGEWYFRGACRFSNLGTDAWFDANTQSVESKRARAVCRRCPVWESCLRDAIRIPGTVGIWGGLDEYERRDLLNRHRARKATPT